MWDFHFVTPAHLSGGLCLLQAALDLMNPHLALPTVTPRLHPGAVCAVYLAKCVHLHSHCHLLSDALKE